MPRIHLLTILTTAFDSTHEVCGKPCFSLHCIYYNENRWMMNCQYPEKGCYFCQKLRDIFGKLQRTFIFIFSLLHSTQGNVEIIEQKILCSSLFFWICRVVFFVCLSFHLITFLPLNFPKVGRDQARSQGGCMGCVRTPLTTGLVSSNLWKIERKESNKMKTQTNEENN